MRRSITALILVLLVGVIPSRAYVRARLGDPPFSFLRWDLLESGTDLGNVQGGKVLYRLHPSGSDDVTGGSDLAALEAAFDTWEGVPDASISFLRDVDLSGVPAVSIDTVNSLFWTENSTLLGGGLDITGALAVTFTFAFISGLEVGEIVDADIVFNGVEFSWTTMPESNPSRIDIQSVAVHEIGHLLGLDHSPIGFSTLFPRVKSGNRLARTLAPDDRTGLSVIYPGSGFSTGTGVLAGSLTVSGVPRFGGHVVATDPEGNVVAGVLSEPDGSYRMEGLYPGTYMVFADPLDPAGGLTLFSEENLGPFYTGLDTDFFTTPEVFVAVLAGAQATLPIAATSATFPLNVLLVRDSSLMVFTNGPNHLFQGDQSVTIGVAGPGLPASGSPLSVSGAGITVLSTQFGVLATGSPLMPFIEAVVNVDPDASAGGRSLVVTSGAQRTVAAGFLEILGILLVSAEPSSALQGESATVRLLGEGFEVSTTVDFGAGITVTGSTLVSAGELSVDIQVDLRALLGPREIRVTNPDGSTSSLPGGLEIEFDCARADLNGSTRVDGFDLSRFARAFGGTLGRPGFVPEADFDGDDDVDGTDLALFVPLFGGGVSTCSG